MTTENQNEQKNEVVAQQPTALATTSSGSNYISVILEQTKQGFIEANEGLDMDFVRMGDWLTINSKGNFVEKDNDSVTYGDSIDVVVGFGEKRFSLWGQEDSPEAGQLIVAERGLEDARAALGEFLALNPDAAERYSEADIKLRYMAWVVPVKTLSPEDFPNIYLMSFSPSDTIGWGRYAMNLFQGKFKGIGVPGRLGANKVVTRLTTEERKQENRKWIGIKFEPIGVFNPTDYGINPEQALK